jgi:hypothetical protein
MTTKFLGNCVFSIFAILTLSFSTVPGLAQSTAQNPKIGVAVSESRSAEAIARVAEARTLKAEREAREAEGLPAVAISDVKPMSLGDMLQGVMLFLAVFAVFACMQAKDQKSTRGDHASLTDSNISAY